MDKGLRRELGDGAFKVAAVAALVAQVVEERDQRVLGASRHVNIPRVALGHERPQEVRVPGAAPRLRKPGLEQRRRRAVSTFLS